MNNSEAEKHQPEKVETTLDKLGLSIGEVLYLETTDPAARYPVRLVGFFPNQSVLVTNPVNAGRLVLFKKDRPVVVRAFVRNRVCAFNSFVKLVCGQPFPYLHLDYPREVTALEVRKAERVGVRIPVSVGSDFDIGAGDWPRPAVIVDLSKGGAAVRAAKSLGDPGHELILRFRLTIADVSQELQLHAIIRNRQLLGASDDGMRLLYGVELVRMTDADRIALTGFLYEQGASG